MWLTIHLVFHLSVRLSGLTACLWAAEERGGPGCFPLAPEEGGAWVPVSKQAGEDEGARLGVHLFLEEGREQRPGGYSLPPTLSPHTGSFEAPRGVAQEWRKAGLAPPLLSHAWSMIATCWASDYPAVCRPAEAMEGWAGDVLSLPASLGTLETGLVSGPAGSRKPGSRKPG